MKPQQIVNGLRQWVVGHDPHVQAAVQVLIEHGHWLYEPEFTQHLLHDRDTGEVWVIWRQLRTEFDAGRVGQGSSTERAMLDFAIALGEDRFRLSRLDSATSDLLLQALKAAVGGS